MHTLSWRENGAVPRSFAGCSGGHATCIVGALDGAEGGDAGSTSAVEAAPRGGPAESVQAISSGTEGSDRPDPTSTGRLCEVVSARRQAAKAEAVKTERARPEAF